MRIYAEIEDIGTEYCSLVPTKISLDPIKGRNCYYIDLEPGKEYYSCRFEGAEEEFDWKPYKKNCK